MSLISIWVDKAEKAPHVRLIFIKTLDTRKKLFVNSLTFI